MAARFQIAAALQHGSWLRPSFPKTTDPSTVLNALVPGRQESSIGVRGPSLDVHSIGIHQVGDCYAGRRRARGNHVCVVVADGSPGITYTTSADHPAA